MLSVCMLFYSYTFIFLFLPFCLGMYFYLHQKTSATVAKVFLVLCGLFFYAWWKPEYTLIILASVGVNFGFGRLLVGRMQKKVKKSLLALGVGLNVLLLGFFKYADFLIENTNLLFGSNIAGLGLVLPLAISFFTFQQIAYLVDCYRGETKEYGLLNYILFVTFFPQLIAGPIVHHKEMMVQFSDAKKYRIDDHHLMIGLFLFAVGLWKKVVIADGFALWANHGFDVATELSMFEAWVTSLSYTFQLYFDFSGYTDMAMGIALLFNIRLPINFYSPYKALNIQDFWRRWHITLSRFLRDYVYIPLGGNQLGEMKMYGNLLLTFLIGGLWHGAGWTFVFWGFLHGIATIGWRLWKKTGVKMPRILAWLLTFQFVNIAWVFFRALSWADALKILRAMFGVSASTHAWSSQNIWHVVALTGMMLALLVSKNSCETLFDRKREDGFSIAASEPLLYGAMMFVALLFLSMQRYTEFIYFNF